MHSGDGMRIQKWDTKMNIFYEIKDHYVVDE